MGSPPSLCCTSPQVADLGALQQQLSDLEQQAASSDLWEQRERAQVGTAWEGREAGEGFACETLLDSPDVVGALFSCRLSLRACQCSSRHEQERAARASASCLQGKDTPAR